MFLAEQLEKKIKWQLANTGSPENGRQIACSKLYAECC